MTTWRPSAVLAEHVAFYWHAEMPVDPTGPDIERVLPDGGMQIVVSLRDAPMRVYDRDDPSRWVAEPSAIVTGPADRYSLISRADTAATVGVVFRPGGAMGLLGCPASELFDSDADVGELWGRTAGDELRNRVMSAATPRHAVAVLDDMLCRRVHARMARHPAVAYAVRELRRLPSAVPVADVVGRVGLSHRRFLDHFTAAVGLTPKRFSRLQRFQAVLRGKATGDASTWVTLAADCGYADQSHLVRDFRAFAGLTPDDYLRRRTAFANHVVERARHSASTRGPQ